MDKFSSAGNQELAAIEDLYQSYLENPSSVDPSWQQFFAGFELARANFQPQQAPLKSEHIDKEFAILSLIQRLPATRSSFYKNQPCARPPEI